MGLNQLGKQLEQVIPSSITVLYWFIEELMLLNNSLVRFCCHWVDILKCLLDKRGSFTQTCSKQQDVYTVMFVWNLFTSFCFVDNMMAWQVWSSQVFCWQFLLNTNLHKLGYVIDNTYNNAKRGNNGHYILLKILWEKIKNLGPCFCFLHSKHYPPPPSTFIDELVFLLNLLFMMVQGGGEDTRDVY